MPTMLTVKQAVRQAREDGFPISEHALRRWIKNGEVPYRTPGTKILIYYPNLIAYLKGETMNQQHPTLSTDRTGEIAIDPSAYL